MHCLNCWQIIVVNAIVFTAIIVTSIKKRQSLYFMWSSILFFCPLCKLFSWGQNGSGQLGIGTTYQHLQPCMVPFFNIFVKKVKPKKFTLYIISTELLAR